MPAAHRAYEARHRTSPMTDAAAALAARPRTVAAHPAQPGIHALEAGHGVIYVPPGYRHEQPAPLVVMLHCAGGDAAPALDGPPPAADRDRALILPPQTPRHPLDPHRDGLPSDP